MFDSGDCDGGVGPWSMTMFWGAGGLMMESCGMIEWPSPPRGFGYA